MWSHCCLISKFDPWDISVLPHISKPVNWSCTHPQKNLSYISKGKLHIDFGEESLKSCRYRCFIRDKTKTNPDYDLTFENWQNITVCLPSMNFLGGGKIWLCESHRDKIWLACTLMGFKLLTQNIFSHFITGLHYGELNVLFDPKVARNRMTRIKDAYTLQLWRSCCGKSGGCNDSKSICLINNVEWT